MHARLAEGEGHRVLCSAATSAAAPAVGVGVRKGNGADKGGHLEKEDIVIYQYKICPFCNKVKAVMDYLGITYNVTEVRGTNLRLRANGVRQSSPFALVAGELRYSSRYHLVMTEAVWTDLSVLPFAAGLVPRTLVEVQDHSFLQTNLTKTVSLALARRLHGRHVPPVHSFSCQMYCTVQYLNFGHKMEISLVDRVQCAPALVHPPNHTERPDSNYSTIQYWINQGQALLGRRAQTRIRRRSRAPRT